MQAIGQFNQHNTDILSHGQQHLAQIFRLQVFLLLFGIVTAAYDRNDIHFGYPIDQLGDAIAELLPNILQGNVRIFHHIVQHGRTDGFSV